MTREGSYTRSNGTWGSKQESKSQIRMDIVPILLSHNQLSYQPKAARREVVDQVQIAQFQIVPY